MSASKSVRPVSKVREQLERVLVMAPSAEAFVHELESWLAELQEESPARPVATAFMRRVRLADTARMTRGVLHDVASWLGGSYLTLSVLNLELEELLAEEENERLRAVSVGLREALTSTQAAAELIRDARSVGRTKDDEPADTRLYSAIRAALQLLPSAADRGVVHLSGPVPEVRVAARRRELLRVLSNLLVNAIDAARERRDACVSIAAWTTPELAFVQVEDNGEGLAPGSEDDVFQASYTTKQDGSGLGLFVARTLVNGWGGRIQVDSKPGRGASFTFSIPLVTD